MNVDVVRAWKDPGYRACLSSSELAGMPAHPAGSIDLTEGEMARVFGRGQDDTLELLAGDTVLGACSALGTCNSIVDVCVSFSPDC